MPHPIDEFDPKTSILFLGSGFSLGATNIAGDSPPNGSQLRKHFIRQLGLPTETDYDFKILTDEFAKNDNHKLSRELQNIFRIKFLNENQKSILDESWRRIYTTNHDDAVEVFRQGKQLPRNDFDISDDIPNKLPNGAVIHIHGYIGRVKEDNIQDTLVLGEKSYVNQYITRSPWYDQFQRDLDFANKIFIVGYSLADYHISALLSEVDEIAKKTIFIQGPEIDDIFKRRTESYGSTFFIGTEGFADCLKSASRSSSPTDLNLLKSFRILSPIKDKSVISEPTSSKIYDLLVYGNFNTNRLARSLPNQTYAILRENKINESLNHVKKCNTLIVEGRLGNGKTLFLYMFAYELIKYDYKCFMFIPGNPEFISDLEKLKNIKNLVIFIENYLEAQDAINIIKNDLPNAKFIVETRSGTFDVRYHEFQRLFPNPINRISLNSLDKTEKNAFSTLCRKAGLPFPKDIEDIKSREMRDLLLEMFQSKSIQDKLRDSLEPLFRDNTTKQFIVQIMLISKQQVSADSGFIRTLINADPFINLKGADIDKLEVIICLPISAGPSRDCLWGDN